MGAGSDAPHLDEYAFRLVACKARQLIGQYGFTADDQPDIRQDLLADLLHRLPSFDSSRASLHTFINRVVEHGVAGLIERRKAAMRDYRQCVYSLNDPIEDGDGEQAERGDLVDQDAYLESMGQADSSLADQVTLRVSLNHLRDTLPPELRVLWDRFEEGQTLTDIWQQTGIRRGTLWRRKKRLEKLAEEAGLRDR